MRSRQPLRRGRVHTTLLVTAAGLLAACGGDTQPDAAGIATYRGGVVSQGDAEQVLRRRSNVATSGPEELVGAYRNAAESVVLDRLLLAERDLDALLAALGDDARAIERRVWVAAFLAPRLGDQRVSDEEIESFYAEHRGELHREARRDLWHLYRRHRDPAHPEATFELLRELKRRAEAGEGFTQLAREYSDSETRSLGGRLGMIAAGRLPKAIEDAVFALPAGSVSEPIAVPGGATLFYVGEVIEGRDFPLADVRAKIAGELADRKRRARIAELVGDREPPPGSTVLEPERLREVLAGADDRVVVLSIGDDRLTAGELRRRIETPPGFEVPVLEPPPRERLLRAYEDERNDRLLYLAARETATPPQLERSIEERLRQLAGEALVQRRLEERMRQRASGDEATLRRFWTDNQHLYQTPLRLELQTLTVAAGRDAPATLAALEAARAELALGAIDFETAAARVGGLVNDLGWVDFATFASFEPKVRYYVLELTGRGYTVPFQLNRRLWMVWVKDRDEPRSLPFDDLRERVVDDYLDRHHQQLYRATVDALLGEAAFRFDEQAVRRVLAATAPGPTATD